MEKDRKYNGQITHKTPKYYTKYEHRECLTNTKHGGTQTVNKEIAMEDWVVHRDKA